MIINTLSDITNYVSNSNPGNVGPGAADRVASAIQAADHPAYGEDWSAWLDANAERLALAATAPAQWHAAIGTDGMRPVVWGVGESADAAREDAARSDDLTAPEVEALDLRPISDAIAVRIQHGEVTVESLGI